jgi:hypothetical protein
MGLRLPEYEKVKQGKENSDQQNGIEKSSLPSALKREEEHHECLRGKYGKSEADQEWKGRHRQNLPHS